MRSERHRRGLLHPSHDVRFANPPVSDDPVRRRAPMERARRLAVEVLRVFLDAGAELEESELGVHRLHRVEGPLDEIVAPIERTLPLLELQAQPQSTTM